LREAVAGAEEWLRSAAKASTDELHDQRVALEEIANPIVARLYGTPVPTPASAEAEEPEAQEDEADEYEEYYGDSEL